ncbi:CAF17-like 4Fe-4S cluster assembly/insertion protein YgfZ [Maricaulis sp. CAU 1757]
MSDPFPDLHALPGRTVISVIGPDARSFLQRVITADIEAVGPGHCVPSALLTPQGKVLADFLVFADGDAVWLDCLSPAADGLVKRLSLFRLRAKAEIAVHADLVPVWSRDAFDGSAADPRLDGTIHRGLCQTGGEAPQARPLDAHEIRLGCPAFGRDYGEAQVFPTDVNLDLYGGIGWKKGCFIGQEVVSRMKRRGSIRKRTVPAVFAGHAPAPGTPVTAGPTTIGEISSADGHTALVLARLDKLRTAEHYCEADGQQANLTVPDAYWPPQAADRV